MKFDEASYSLGLERVLNMKEGTSEDYRARMLRVLVHIQQNLDGPLPLEELASIALFSPFHFHRIFRGLIGESVKEHVRRLRLERAAHRLRHTGQQITEIALDAGYQSLESFTRAFHRMFGQSPTEFRARRGVVAYGPAPSGVHYVAVGALENFHPVPGKALPLEVRIEHLPEMRVAFVRHTGPYEETDAAYERLMTWAGIRGLLKPPVVIFGIAYDDPTVTAPENLRYDAALVIAEDQKAEGEIGVRTIQGGKYAVTTHCGSYETLGETYTRFCGEWLPLSGLELLPAPALEFYRNSPQDTPPEKLLTDIYMRLAT
jgi:AraC family transcriptional regulator